MGKPVPPMFLDLARILRGPSSGHSYSAFMDNRAEWTRGCSLNHTDPNLTEILYFPSYGNLGKDLSFKVFLLEYQL